MTIRSINTSGLPQGVLTPMGDLLFAASEPGAWYDPSDLSTLFQDTAGTTPVTAVEQAVALMLDKSGRGNHASQATSTKRPKYSRRVNLLTKTEDFADAAWVKSATTLDGTTHLAPDGTSTATKIVFAAGNVNAIITQTVPATIGSTVRKIWMRADTPTTVRNRFRNNNGSVASPVLSVTAEWQEIETAIVGTGTGIDTVGLQNNAAGDSAPIYVWSPRLTLAIDANLPYQRVNTSTDYDADPNKFPAYLACDGIDDALQTGNIDFTGTDKMTVWAGVTKLSDAATGMLAELSTGLSGSFYVAAPQGASATYNVRVGGTTLIAATSPANYAAPITSVLTGIGDTSGDSVILRINGSQVAANALDQGTGNYGNYPLYIGSRGGTSLFFNGRLYSLIVRGAQSSLSQIEATENLIRQKMRLP